MKLLENIFKKFFNNCISTVNDKLLTTDAKIQRLESKVKDLNGLICCDTCGCYFDIKKSYVGPKEIRPVTRTHTNKFSYWEVNSFDVTTDEIVTPFYCIHCYEKRNKNKCTTSTKKSSKKST